jgi:signal transduction histidine kinase
MNRYTYPAQHLIAQVSRASWMPELDRASERYNVIGCWVAIIGDPIFAITDYINIPEHWQILLAIRLCVSALVFTALAVKRIIKLSSHTVVAVPFLLISIQNAFTYQLIGSEDLLGHNLNYMALFVGAAMFVLWRLSYSVIIVGMSLSATAFFIFQNPVLDPQDFFLKGGLLLIVVEVFAIILIQTRHNLTVREIKARLALQISNEEIQAQGEEIQVINENLEAQVKKRTQELERKNKVLEEYAFINAHKLRGPLASILGLINLLNKAELNHEARSIMEHMSDSAQKLDSIVGTITKTIERGDNEQAKMYKSETDLDPPLSES